MPRGVQPAVHDSEPLIARGRFNREATQGHTVKTEGAIRSTQHTPALLAGIRIGKQIHRRSGQRRPALVANDTRHRSAAAKPQDHGNLTLLPATPLRDQILVHRAIQPIHRYHGLTEFPHVKRRQQGHPGVG